MRSVKGEQRSRDRKILEKAMSQGLVGKKQEEAERAREPPSCLPSLLLKRGFVLAKMTIRQIFVWKKLFCADFHHKIRAVLA